MVSLSKFNIVKWCTAIHDRNVYPAIFESGREIAASNTNPSLLPQWPKVDFKGKTSVRSTDSNRRQHNISLCGGRANTRVAQTQRHQMQYRQFASSPSNSEDR